MHFYFSYKIIARVISAFTKDNNTSSEPISDMNQDELLARLAYLEAENDFLKKFHALEAQANKKDSC
jgi:hypothetical protein